jgi:hypothetical protein
MVDTSQKGQNNRIISGKKSKNAEKTKNAQKPT